MTQRESELVLSRLNLELHLLETEQREQKRRWGLDKIPTPLSDRLHLERKIDEKKAELWKQRVACLEHHNSKPQTDE